MDKRQCTITISITIGVLTAIGAIIVLVIGFGMVSDYSTSAQLSSFKNTTCFLTAVTIVELSPDMFCSTNRFVSVYRNLNGYSAIDNPYAAFALPFDDNKQNTRSEPVYIDYPLNTTIPCFCDFSYNSSFYIYPSVKSFLKCNTDAQCFLNIQLIQEIKDRIDNYNYALLLLEIGLIVLSIVVILSFLITIIFCCCIKDRKTQYQIVN